MSRPLKDLKGKRVLATSSAKVAGALIRALEDAGARPLHIPLVLILPPRDGYASLDRAISRLSSFDWVVFTSRNAVDAFLSRLGEGRLPKSVRIAAVGPGTAEELSMSGIVAMAPGGTEGAEGPVRFIAPLMGRGERVLWPRAAGARDALSRGLSGAGAVVEEALTHETSMPCRESREALARVVDEGGVDAVLFDSPSAVKNFVLIVGRERARLFSKRTLFVPIGPVTERAMREIFDEA